VVYIKSIAIYFLAGLLLFLAACTSSAAPVTPPAEPEPAPAPEPQPEPPVKPPPESPSQPDKPASEPVEPPPQSPPAEPAEESEPLSIPPAPASAGVIRLFYYGHVMTPGVDPAAISGLHAIYSATSNDGINFTEDPGVRFSYDTGSQFGITDPDVVRMNDGSWLMFISLGQSLLKGTSPDSSGIFAHDASFSWDKGGVPGSYNFEGTVRTFVTFGDEIHAAVYEEASGSLKYEGVALSKPSTGAVQSPSVIEVDGTYYMIYLYRPTPMADPREHEIYMATSQDGVTWSQHDQNRFICNSSVPGAVYYNGIIYIYLCGVHLDPQKGEDMGVAVSLDKGKSFEFYGIKITGKAMSGIVDPAAIVDSE
jgi:hypothetical protein